MGQVIYVSGQIDVNINKIKKVLNITNHFGECAFMELAGSIMFQADIMEGMAPFQNDVLKPIKDLIKIRDINAEGIFYVGRDYDDDNNTAVVISTRDGKTTYKLRNAAILNAETKELIEELENRGYACKKTA